MRRRDLLGLLAAAGLVPATARASGGPPATPLRVGLAAKGRVRGRRGGTVRMLIAEPRDVQYMVVYGYARLVAFDEDFTLRPDIAEAVAVDEGRRFLFALRPDHRWSDGHPFTSEDFRYFWEDVALNRELSPSGPPASLVSGGALPSVTVLDERRVLYEWPEPNPRFLASLAGPRPPFIYRPAHYLKAFHARYADPKALAALAAAERVSGWAALHNRRDNLHRFDNPDLPTLQPWMNVTAPPARRFVMLRNPHFHRVDEAGVQLPYIDRVELAIADQRLFATKAVAGETDLQGRGLAFADAAVLRASETPGGYATRLWRDGTGSAVALYPNLNASDPIWRAILRDRRTRHALSLGIDREAINQSLFLGLGRPGNNTVLRESPLYEEDLFLAHARHDPAEAARLLEEAGFRDGGAGGILRLPDGRPAEIVVETAGESETVTDVLSLVAEAWRDIGLRLLIKPSERSVLRNRVYAGEAVMSAWGGFDLALATGELAPDALAPVRQDMLCWPKWGQHFETRGAEGEPVDLPPAQELLALRARWERAPGPGERAAIWQRMLAIHAEELFTIGTVQGALQPVVVSRRLRNVPESGIWAWEPTAYFGIYRPDEFWLEEGA
ncbi:MAG: ABC transporter substrate-binding protein [Alphaproteobacteria bacterium]|nr:ABC transporter substrate-binding protein [Alphaproteobacteria bacterium]